MLDRKKQVVLLALYKECQEGYKVFDIQDFLSALTLQNPIENSELKQILKQFDKLGYCSLKYIDDECFCLALLAYGRQEIENYNSVIIQNKKIKGLTFSICLFVFLLAFLGAFLGTLFINIIF